MQNEYEALATVWGSTVLRRGGKVGLDVLDPSPSHSNASCANDILRMAWQEIAHTSGGSKDEVSIY